MDGKVLNLSKIKICFYLRRKHIFLPITPKFFRQCVQVDRSCRVRDFKFAQEKTVCLALISTLITSHESATGLTFPLNSIASFLTALEANMVVLVSVWDIFLRGIVYVLWCDFLQKVL